jgi:TM2 domain-containing membrane protein YozV
MYNPYFVAFKSVEPEELAYLQQLTQGWDEQRLQQFAVMYGSQRKDSQTIMICCLLGFVFVGGIQRFMLDDMGMGILYLLTGGLCWIGTIMDLMNYRKMTTEYNTKLAYKMAMMMGAPQQNIQR